MKYKIGDAVEIVREVYTVVGSRYEAISGEKTYSVINSRGMEIPTVQEWSLEPAITPEMIKEQGDA